MIKGFKLSLFVFFSLLCILLTERQIAALPFSKESPRSLTQDESKLEDSNGKIINQKLLKGSPGFRSKIDCYRIQYWSDGLRVVGFVVKPREIASKLPVIVFNRGGGLEFGKITQENLKYFAFLASKGYVLLASQYRGNDGGEGHEEFGGKDVDDVLNLIRLAKSLPFVDPDRMVMLGFSRGGMMTYLAIKEGAPIRAAAVVGGVCDLLDLYREKKGNKLDYIIGKLVGSDMEEYKRRSACYWPEKIDAPVLILHGGRDRVVDPRQAKELGERLKELGKVYELDIFRRGDHGLDNYKKKRDQENTGLVSKIPTAERIIIFFLTSEGNRVICSLQM